ncbi:MAG TPA: TonB-dependent receptor [Halieaceae bacterium]|nr:TonB-dependent receptor [Haliea sp.]HAN68538.1 TonB-dependent receptor [Halieaceae bacterium]MAY93027.1 TonB-dependent receptor [Haliea sp.]MBK39770.1 TonB-dependent receptor [Haliea sp.]MBP69437.1 TonB-dependent receptor [Haliea sp.]
MPLASAILLASSVAVAQPALEEVIVTAEKRSESLQDTPISIAALDAEALEKFGITDMVDLQGKVPNLQITPHPNSMSTPRIFIRGVGNFDDQITQDPSVAVYMDGVYVARSQGMGIEVAELERIEVLRGPQGALYGRNATGGAINFVTRAPELDEWRFSQSVTSGDRDLFTSRTMINIPLGETTALRLSYLTTEQDGFIRNAGSGEEYFGSEDREALRADFLWRPNDELEFRYGYDRSKIDDSPYYLAYQTADTPLERPDASNPAVNDLLPHDIDIDGHQATVTWTPTDHVTLKSITAFRQMDSFLYQDYLSGRFGPVASLITRDTLDQDQWSQEFQVLGNALDQKLDYVAGIYYFREDGNWSNRNSLPAFGQATGDDAEVENRAFALYAQATWTPELLDNRLHATLGGRWSRDQRQAELSKFALVAGDVVPLGTGDGDKTFTNFSPSFTLAYDLGDTSNVYAKVGSGYKTGGFNVRPSTIERFEEGFDEETLLSWELGVKSELWNNRLRVNAAAFYADYDDIQVNASSDINDPTRADILNAGEGTIQGLELDVTAALHQRLTLALSYGYLDAGYDEIIDAFGNDVTDNYAFINAPQHSVLADLDWDIAELPIGELRFNLNYNWQDEKAITTSTVNGLYTTEAYGLLNARLTLAEIPGLPAGSLRIAAWGRNLDDKTYAFINAPLFGGFRAYGEPRTRGCDINRDYWATPSIVPRINS